MYIFCSSSFSCSHIPLLSVFITMFNKCTISNELCSSYSLSFTCFFVYLHLIHSYSIIPCHVVSHVIITWSNTSSIPHQYPIPVTQFILSLRTAATSTTSTTHSFTIPTEPPSSKIPKSKLGTFHTFKTHTGAFAPCPSLTNTYSHLFIGFNRLYD